MRRKSAVWALIFCTVFLFGQEQPTPAPPANTANQVFVHLARAIAWYQHIAAIEEGSSATENLLQRDNARAAAKRALQATFDFGRAEAAIVSSAPGANEDGATASSMQQSLIKASARVTKLQQRLQSLDARLAQASGSVRPALSDERAAIAADLALAKQMEATVKTMTSFNAPQASKGHGLLDEINSLATLNTASESTDDKDKPQTAAASSNVADSSLFRPETAGIIVLLSKVFTAHGLHVRIELARKQTERFGQEIDGLRAPLRKSIKAIVAQSDTISSSEDSAIQPSEWLNTSKQISELSSQFKELSSVLLPLSESAVALQSVRGALDEWEKQTDDQLSSTVRYLMIRVGVLVGGALFILLGSAIWQRAIFRYVVEPRRKRQLLLVKRVVVGFALVLLLVLGFFSSLGSMATLLGLVTAGLALALQNVILSMVAYFFLIGRYGLRVGDRVTVQGVTGEVIEVGLVRLFLMEFAGTGTDMHPTGRLAVFANSVIFQPAALMKQAPGLDYAWHALTVTVEDAADYQQTRARLTQAVTSVYDEYRQAIDQQHKAFEQTTHVPTAAPAPVSLAQFTESGLTVTIRYPVALGEKPGQIDERMVDCVIAEAEHEPKLKFTAAGSPKISQVV